MQTVQFKINWSSVGNGGFNAVSSKLRLNRTIPHTTFHQMVDQMMENYMFFPIKSAFEYLHQLNRKESS